MGDESQMPTFRHLTTLLAGLAFAGCSEKKLPERQEPTALEKKMKSRVAAAPPELMKPAPPERPKAVFGPGPGGPTGVLIDPAPPPPAAPTAHTREQLMTMYARRDTHCGTGDPWAMFSAGPKSAPDVASLKEWATDPKVPAESRAGALWALHTERGPEMTGWWRSRLAATPRATNERTAVALGLLASDGSRAVPEVYALLGESEELDLALLTAADEHSEAAPQLRAYQRSKKAAPRVQAELTRQLLELDPANAGDDAEQLLAGGKGEDIWAALASGTPSVAVLEKSLAYAVGPGANDALMRDMIVREVAFKLRDRLKSKDAGAVALAEKWSKDLSPQRLEHAPHISLLLGTWKASRGELKTADAIFAKALKFDRGAPAEGSNADMDDPIIADAAMLVLRACAHDSMGAREEAVKLMRTYDLRRRAVAGDVDNLLTNITFEGWKPWGCYRSNAQALADSPREVTAQRKPRRGK